MQDNFRVKLKNPEDYQGVVSAVQAWAWCRLQDLRGILEPVFAVAQSRPRGDRRGVLVAVARRRFQIGNTIRMAAFSRRRELGIMSARRRQQLVHRVAVPARIAGRGSSPEPSWRAHVGGPGAVRDHRQGSTRHPDRPPDRRTISTFTVLAVVAVAIVLYYSNVDSHTTLPARDDIRPRPDSHRRCTWLRDSPPETR